MLKKSATVQWNREKWMAILSFIVASLLCSSCTSPSSIAFDENKSMKEEKQLSRWGELSPVSGTTDQVQQPAYQFDPSIMIPQLPELTGLAERTNLVFQSVMGNDVLYERPGATLEFSVHENPHLIRFRLVQVHEDFVMLNTVMEQTTSETHFEIQLPNQENVLYILSLEAVNEQKETIDTAIYLIEAVPQVVNAELSLDQTIFRANQTTETTLHLKNYGPNMLYFGGNYSIEQYENGEWYQVPLSLDFNSRAYSSVAGEVFSQRLEIPAQLSAGKYRVMKDIDARGVAYTSSERFDRIYLAVEFEVIGNE